MIVPVMAISNLVLTLQIYSKETNGAHAHKRDRVPLMYKLVDSTKCRLQTDCRPLFSGLENNGTINGFTA